MTFRELLEKVVFDGVWLTFNKEYCMKGEAFEDYFKVFNQLKGLTPEPNHDDFRLVVDCVEAQQYLPVDNIKAILTRYSDYNR